MSDALNDLPDEDAPGGPDGNRTRVRKSPTAFRTISEVADELHVPQHVLRFWETKFPQVKPLKRGGGRRYYRPDDLALLKRISDLLYIQGYTIKGVQRLLREGRSDDDAAAAEAGMAEIEDETPEAELPPGAPEDEERAGVAAGDDAEAEPPIAPPPRDDGEAERLRAALRDTLAALEALRAALD